MIIAGLGLAVLAISASYWLLAGGSSAAAHRLSVIVLPFKNLSGDAEQAYFAEGITDDLTTALSRIEDSFVIAPATARAYQGFDPKRLGRELGVRYMLDGSVRRTDTVVRVSAQLIDTETRAQVWSDRVDGNWTASMEVQDIITSQLARRLDLELTEQEIRRAEDLRASSPDAVDLAMRGWSVLNKPYSRAISWRNHATCSNGLWQSIPICKRLSSDWQTFLQ